MPDPQLFVRWFIYLVATFVSIPVIFFISWIIITAIAVGAVIFTVEGFFIFFVGLIFLPITGISSLVALISGLIIGFVYTCIKGFVRTRLEVPQLPDEPFDQNRLPLQIGSNVSVEHYNAFLDRCESSGYKFQLRDNGDVFIIDMADGEHEHVVTLLQDYFKTPNGGVIVNPPMFILGQPFHYCPSGSGAKIAPDVAVYPSLAYIPKPNIPHPGPPPSDRIGNPHARIVCEVGLYQDTNVWEIKCQSWIRQQYVRCVFGIKIHSKRSIKNAQGQYHRSMTAKLWRQGVRGSRVWDFGTLQKGSQVATGCNAPNLPAYQVIIPVSDVFWDPPIIAGAPVMVGYTEIVPNTINANNFNIDLYQIQQSVLIKQDNN